MKVFFFLPLRQLKVVILSFSDIFLINNGPVADSGIQLPIPLILMYIMYSEVADSTELAREIGHFKIATLTV